MILALLAAIVAGALMVRHDSDTLATGGAATVALLTGLIAYGILTAA